MANASNAYATINPVRANIGDTIQGIEKMDLAYREEQRKIDAIKESQKEAKQKKLDDFIASIPNAKPTGVKTVDEYIMGGMITFPEDVLSNYKEIQALEQKDNRSPAEQEKYMKAKIKAENLKKYPDNLKNFVSGYLESMKEYDTGLSKGLYLPDPEIEKIRADGLKSIVPGRDENGMPTAGFYDENGDGILDALNFDDINKKLVIKPTLKKDAYSLVSELAKGYKPDETKGTKGYYTFNDKLVSENELKSTMEGFIDANSLATEAYRRGLPIDYQWKPEEIVAFKNDLYNHAKTFIQESKELTKNYQDENADLTRQQNAAQFKAKQESEAKKDEKENPTWNVVETPPSYSEARFKSDNGYKTVAINGKAVVPAIEFYNKSTNKKETITNGQIQSYTVVTNSNGKRSIVAEIVHTDTKSRKTKEGEQPKKGEESLASMTNDSGGTRTTGEEKVITIVPLTQAQADIFSKQLGFKNTNEMKNAAKVSETKNNNASSSNKKTIEGF